MDLQLLSAEMVLDGLDAEFVEASEEAPADRVNVLLDVDAFSEEVSLQVTEVETDPDDMPGVAMFQLWAGFPVELDEDALDRVTRFLPAANTITPLIGFNVLPDECLVFFRHVGVVSDQPVALQAVVRSVWLAYYAIDTLARSFVQVAAMALND